jgi:hypothetical protein
VTVPGTNIEATTNALGFIQITIDTVDTLIIAHTAYDSGRIKISEVSNLQISQTRAPSKND